MKCLKNNILLIFASLSLCCLSATSFAQTSDDSAAKNNVPAEFYLWLDQMHDRAIKAGISPALVRQAFSNLVPNDKILSQDRAQPEFTLGFWEYYARGISQNRVTTGKKAFADIAPTLKNIGQQYGVQPRFLMAFWGLESDFGRVKGNYNLIQSLATLAFNPRRRAFFEAELIQLLRIIDQGHMALQEAKGSWAGAFGHTQFMPSTFAAYAVDGDRDGRIHLIDSEIDALTSAAHYLRNLGWDDGKTWGREVILPQGFNYALASVDVAHPLQYWSDRGVTNAWGRPLPQNSVEANLILPVGSEGPAFLVYPNFHRIMRWNRSIFFALNVGLLSDAIAALPPIQKQKPLDYQRLRYSEIKQYQDYMNKLGYNVGTADGIIGKRTRSQLQQLQSDNNLPADGYLGRTTRMKIDQLVGKL